MKIIDISMGINEGMLIYPKNLRPNIKKSKSISKNKVNQSIISIESHTGTHIDSAYHALSDGWKISKVKIERFMGSAIVVDVTKAGAIISAEALSKSDIRPNDTVLLKTENSLHEYKKFRKDYASLSISGAEYLSSKRVNAVGIDYLSIEKYMGDMSVHKKLLRNNILIYEGLILKGIKPGRYKFIGIPIDYDGDAAPARVFLLNEG